MAGIRRISDLGTRGTVNIVDGSIQTADISDGVVTSLKITDGTISTSDIANSAITSAKLATNIDVSGTLTSSGNFTAVNGGVDGGLTIRPWLANSIFLSLGTRDMTGSEYCLITEGTNTYLGSGTSGVTYIRGPVNSTTAQISVSGSSLTFTGPSNFSSYIDVGSTGITNPGSVGCSGWFRSTGASGWYNQTYGGGIWMDDSTYIKIYGSKILFSSNGYAGGVQYGSYGGATIVGTTGGYTGWASTTTSSAVMWSNTTFGHYRNNSSWNFYVENGVFNSSDARYKRNIQPLNYGLEFINKIEPVSFERLTETDEDDPDKTDGRTYFGFTTQQILDVLNEMGELRETSIIRIGVPNSEETNDRQYLNTGEFIAPIIKAIQEMSQKIERLESIIANFNGIGDN